MAMNVREALGYMWYEHRDDYLTVLAPKLEAALRAAYDAGREQEYWTDDDSDRGVTAGIAKLAE